MSLWVGLDEVCVRVGPSFQSFAVVQVPNTYRYLFLIRLWAALLLGSSNAKTNDDIVFALYVPGGLTQLGLCVMFSAAYSGLSFASAVWHSSGVQGPRRSETPVGILLMTIFDHLTFAVICGAFVCLRTVGNFKVIVSMIGSSAKMSCCSVLECPPVSTMFPFAVHLAEEM